MTITLGLVMIVKNAEGCIERTLRAIKPYISYYGILDTGSTDNTVRVIRETMKDVDGMLYQEPFVDFSTSRNRILDLVGEATDYVIMLDDSYELHGGADLVKFLSKDGKDSYHLPVYNTYSKDEYYSNRIFRAKAGIRYKYKIHEVPDTTDVFFTPSSVRITDYVDILSIQRSSDRYERDIELLKEYADTDRRLAFHLAMTYYTHKSYHEAYDIFTRIAKDETIIDNYLYQSMYFAAMIRIKEFYEPTINVIDSFKRICELFPFLVEPFYRMAVLFYNEGAINRAHLLVRHAITIPFPEGKLYTVQRDLYDFEVKFLYIFVTFYTQDLDESKRVYKELRKAYPDNLRLDNFKYMLYPDAPLSKKMLLCEKPHIVINASSSTMWDPEHIHTTASGSEVMATNIAKELSKLGNHVVVFGKLTQAGVFDGVEFRDMEEYTEYIRTHVINIFIASRNVNDLVFLPNILKVYFWIHDILPIGGDIILARRDRFGGFLCISEWQKQRLIRDFAVSPDVIHVTRNAIYPERFSSSIQKVPHRFVYHSSPDRGLKYLIQLAPRICERYPDATFEIFCNPSGISRNDLDTIATMQYIHVHGRVSQSEIAKELLSGDVWLYPTDFDETYCIAAVEAQMAGCLCVAMNMGALKEIIYDRGIVVDGDIREAETQSKLLEKMFFVMDRPTIQSRLVQKAKEWASHQTFSDLAVEWNVLFSRNDEVDMSRPDREIKIV